jgi:hypothetical protein
MLRWLGGAIKRIGMVFFAWSLLVLGIAAFVESRGAVITAEMWINLFRFTLYLVLLFWVVAERDATQDVLDGLSGEPAPEDAKVGERTLNVVRFLSWPWFAMWFRWAEPNLDAALLEAPLVVPSWGYVIVVSGAWALLLGGVFALIRAGLSLMWARQRADKSPSDLPRALPLFTAGVVGTVLLPTLLGKIGLMAVGAVLLLVPLLLIFAAQQGGERMELLVTIQPDDDIDEVVLPLLLHGAEHEPASVHGTTTWVLSVPVERALSLSKVLAGDRENVVRVEVNSAVAVDPTSPGVPCLPSIAGASGRPVVVGIVDTGIQSGHASLADRVLKRSLDSLGHGTAMAGIAATAGDGVRLRSFPALAGPRASADDVAAAILDAVEAKVDVINLSFSGAGRPPRVVVDAVNAALQQGIPVVASAGNTTGSVAEDPPWPASIPGVLVVKATDRYGLPASFSKRAPGVAKVVSAGGESVCAANTAGGWSTTSGTSASAAYVSGAIAALTSACGDTPAAWADALGRGFNADQVRGVIQRCTRGY